MPLSIGRKLGAGLLLLALVLPQSTCIKYVDDAGRSRPDLPYDSTRVSYHRVVEHYYALQRFDVASLDSWLTLVAFTWPALSVLCYARVPSARRRRWVLWIELPLLAGTGYVLWTLPMFDDRAVGNYLGFTALALYLSGWVIEIGARKPVSVAPVG